MKRRTQNVIRSISAIGLVLAVGHLACGESEGGGTIGSPPERGVDAGADADAGAVADAGATMGSGTAWWPMFHGDAQHTGQASVNGPQTASVKWKYRYDTSAAGVPGTAPGNFVVGKDRRVYANAGGKLLAFDGDSGSVLWSAVVSKPGAVALSPDESRIYVVTDSQLKAYTTSGAEIWTFQGPSLFIHGEPTVASDGTIYFGSWDAYVWAVLPDGQLKWKYLTDGAIGVFQSPALSRDESTIYVGSGDPNYDNGGTLYAIAKDGTLRWKVDRLDEMRVSGVVVAPDDTILATGRTRVHRFTKDGVKLWASAEWTASSLPPSLSSTGIVYVGTGPTGKVHALDFETGRTLWSYQTGQNPNYTPGGPRNNPEYGVLSLPVIGADGVVYVGAMDNKMYALKPDGSLLWSYETGNHIEESGPAIASDGTLYFVSADGYIYAIK